MLLSIITLQPHYHSMEMYVLSLYPRKCCVSRTSGYSSTGVGTDLQKQHEDSVRSQERSSGPFAGIAVHPAAVDRHMSQQRAQATAAPDKKNLCY